MTICGIIAIGFAVLAALIAAVAFLILHVAAALEDDEYDPNDSQSS